jgi:hypothetical protein
MNKDLNNYRNHMTNINATKMTYQTLIAKSKTSLNNTFKKGLTLNTNHLIKIHGVISPQTYYVGNGTNNLSPEKYSIFDKTIKPFNDNKVFGFNYKFSIIIDLYSSGCIASTQIVIESKNGCKIIKNPDHIKNIDDESLVIEWYGKKRKNNNRTYFNFITKNGEKHETIMIDDDMHYKCKLNSIELFI